MERGDGEIGFRCQGSGVRKGRTGNRIQVSGVRCQEGKPGGKFPEKFRRSNMRFNQTEIVEDMEGIIS